MTYKKKSGRPKLFSTEEMAEVLYQVFAEKGFMATSISDLTQATGTKPASLYLAFGNKEGMYTAALGHYRRVWLRGLEEILNDKNTSFHQRIASFLSAAFTVFSCEGKPPGCLMTFTALNMQGENSEIGNQLRHERERFQALLSQSKMAWHSQRLIGRTHKTYSGCSRGSLHYYSEKQSEFLPSINGKCAFFQQILRGMFVLSPRVLEAFCLKHAVCRRQKEKSPE